MGKKGEALDYKMPCRCVQQWSRLCQPGDFVGNGQIVTLCREFERFRIKHAIRETYLHVFKRILAEKAINRLIVRQTWSVQGLNS